MREFGKIITRKTDLTDAQVQQKYKFPAIIILHDNEDQILKITHYQKNGTKTIYDFSLSASKQFVTDSIATAIAGLQDNRLEFNEFSDFPAIGDETKFYIDLTDDRIYIWDSYSQTYKNQSWDTAAIASIHASNASAQMAFQNLENSKLDKGTYTGTASDLLLNDQNLSQSLQNEQTARVNADQSLENSKQKKVTVTTITGNTTLSETHNGAVLNVTNTCNITIPTGLDANFQCVIFAKGAVIVTFVNGGVTVYAPSGLLLKTDKMASLISTSANNFNLTGELATS